MHAHEYEKGGGGKCIFTPTKRGGGKSLAMLKGGHKKFWGSFYAVASSFSHTDEEAQEVSTL